MEGGLLAKYNRLSHYFKNIKVEQKKTTLTVNLMDVAWQAAFSVLTFSNSSLIQIIIFDVNGLFFTNEAIFKILMRRVHEGSLEAFVIWRENTQFRKKWPLFDVLPWIELVDDWLESNDREQSGCESNDPRQGQHHEHYQRLGAGIGQEPSRGDGLARSGWHPGGGHGSVQDGIRVSSGERRKRRNLTFFTKKKFPAPFGFAENAKRIPL